VSRHRGEGSGKGVLVASSKAHASDVAAYRAGKGKACALGIYRYLTGGLWVPTVGEMMPITFTITGELSEQGLLNAKAELEELLA
jgi:hypothetical protein